MGICHRFKQLAWPGLCAIALSVLVPACTKRQAQNSSGAGKPKIQAQGPKDQPAPSKGSLAEPEKQAPEAKEPANAAQPPVAAQDAAATPAELQPAGDEKKSGETEARPLYYERLLTPEDLKGRTLREFSLLRNTIFARVGNRFRKTWLDEHFRAQPWYKPADKTRIDLLSAIDKKNVELIVQAQEALSKADLERSRDQLLALDDRSKHQEQELRLLSARLGKWSGDEGTKDPQRTPLEDPKLLDKVLKLSNLREMSRRDLRILRNMIYARRGRAFKSPLVDSYFGRMDWYDPVQEFKSSMLTATDRKNIRIVKSLEHSLGGPIRDTDHPEDDWMYVA